LISSPDLPAGRQVGAASP